VVREAQRGYGAACWAGVLATREECILVFMDGDGSFAAAEIARLVAPIQENRADLVLGARELSGVSEAMPQHARFGNSLATRLLRLLYGLQVSDLGPFRAIRRQLLLDLHMREMVFGWPVEMMVKAARQGYRICEVPVSYRPRLGGESKVSGNLRGTLRAGYRILAVIFTYAQPWSKL